YAEGGMKPFSSLECGIHLNLVIPFLQKENSIIVQVGRFWFACHQSERSEEVVFGTGGQILAMFKKVMGIFSSLRTLELRDLLLEGCEGLQLLDEVCSTCCETLRTLVVINITKLGHTLIHPGAFVNLETLYISPQNIGDDLLELLAESKVRNMYIVQNKYTEHGRSLSYKAWKRCRAGNPRLRVHLCSEGNTKTEIIWQRRAPVKSMVYDNPYARVTTSVILTIIDLYKQDLEVFAYKQLPRFYMPRAFHDRIDSSLILLVRQCPYIHTLVIREKVSTATVLLVAYSAKNLHYFYIRRNAIILKIGLLIQTGLQPSTLGFVRVHARMTPWNMRCLRYWGTSGRLSPISSLK
ncbi:hypothetical protein OTU49_001522, partial [Cherax quadricarinatus]